MAQTTGALSFYAALVKISATSVGWTTMSDISGEGAAVATAGGDRAFGEVNTFKGDVPIVTPGKRGSVSATVRIVYTDAEADAFIQAKTLNEASGGIAFLSWSPGGDATVVYEIWRNSTEGGIMTAFSYPGGEAGDGAPCMCEFTVTGSEIKTVDHS